MSNDPSAGQPRTSGAYSARPPRAPEPTVTLPGFQSVRFPSGRDHVLSPMSAHDLSEALWAVEQSDNRWSIESFDRLDSPVGTVVRVAYTHDRKFVVSFSTGNGGSPTTEQLTDAEGTALRFTLVAQFPEPWDGDDYDEDDDE